MKTLTLLVICLVCVSIFVADVESDQYAAALYVAGDGQQKIKCHYPRKLVKIQGKYKCKKNHIV